MTRYTSFIALVMALTLGIGMPVSFAGDPAPVEKKDKKDMGGSKADNEKNKNEKKDMGGK